jgi:hypothetical protein
MRNPFNVMLFVFGVPLSPQPGKRPGSAKRAFLIFFTNHVEIALGNIKSAEIRIVIFHISKLHMGGGLYRHDESTNRET